MGSRTSTLEEQSPGAALQNVLTTGQMREVLQLLRACEPHDLKRVLCAVAPEVMQGMQGREGYKAKRFLLMREDVLPEAWNAYFEKHAIELFAGELQHDTIVQSALSEGPESIGMNRAPSVPATVRSASEKWG
jgi:hypothetical protein